MIAKPTFLVKSSCVLPVVKTSVKVINYRPRLLVRAWLVLPSKDAKQQNTSSKNNINELKKMNKKIGDE